MKNKKIFILFISNILFGGAMVVTDMQSYSYLISSINQTTQLLQSATLQISTLGGIRTIMEDSKDSINDAKTTLEGSIEALKSAREGLFNTISNTEFESMTDLDAARITSSSNGGLSYKALSNQMDKFYIKLDKEIIKAFGGKYQAKKGLSTNFKDDFITSLNKQISTLPKFITPASGFEFKKDIEKLRIRNKVKQISKLHKDISQTTSASIVFNEATKRLYPNSKEKEKMKKDRERLSKIISYVQSSKDMLKNQKTTNLLLLEILKLAHQDFNNAIQYRNAMLDFYNDKRSAGVLGKVLSGEMKSLKKNDYKFPQGRSGFNSTNIFKKNF